MKGTEKSLNELLDYHLGLFKASSRKHPDTAREGILNHLKSQPADTAEQESSLSGGTAWHWKLLGAAAALILTVLLSANLLHNETFLATVESTEDGLRAGQVFRSNSGSGSMITLADGSRIEMRSNSELALEPANDGLRVRLDAGSVIVNAAKQRTGHLYVQTKDVTVSVVGTVFVVHAEAKGSRVAVIEGEVRVQQGATTKNLLPGEQLATNVLMEPRLVTEEVLWSRSAENHVAALQQAPAPNADESKRLEFEVASFRPLSAAAFETGAFGDTAEIRCKGIDRAWSSQNKNDSANAAPLPLGRCVGVMHLSGFIGIVRGIEHPAAVGILGKVPFELYQLDAKAEDPRTATRDQLLEMLKNLIVDRLQLKFHMETREEQGYALRIADGGVKFKETLLDEERTVRTDDCGFYCWNGRFSMKRFAGGLGSMTGIKPIADMTGLTGVYELKLVLNRVPSQTVAEAGPRGGGPSLAPAEFDPPLSKALERQLGLRLEPGRVPFEYLVVDHVEKPSEN